MPNDKLFKAEIQGVSADFRTANGSFDSVSLGVLTAEQLADILELICALELPVGDDVCYPNLIVEGSKGSTFFTVGDSGGKLLHEGGSEVSVLQAVALASGEPLQSTAIAQPPAKSKAETPYAAPPLAQQDPTSSQTLSPEARALANLLENPVGLRDFRKSFSYLSNGSKDPHFMRLQNELDNGDLTPELKQRLHNYPPRAWALKHPSLGRRFLAFLLDIPLYLIFMGISVAALTQPGQPEGQEPLILAVLLGSALVWFVASEWLLGASPAGLLLGLRVVNKNGGRPSLLFCFGRQFLRLFRFIGILLTLRRAENRPFQHQQIEDGRRIGNSLRQSGGEVVSYK